MQRIDFSDTTNRLRRNLVGAAFVIIVIVHFGIEITPGSVSPLGWRIENISTDVALKILVVFKFVCQPLSLFPRPLNLGW